MSKIIIIEGPDGAGKTTLAQYYARQGFEYRHEGPSPPGITALDYYASKLLEYKRSGRDFVLDRFHLGAFVYGRVLRGKEEIDTNELEIFQRLLSAFNVDVILAIAPFKDCYATWKARRNAELIGSKSKFKEVFQLWRSVQKDYKKRWYSHLWNYKSEKTPPTVSSLPELPEGTIGSPAASYLFIGEKSNGRLDLPFFTMSNSSGFFYWSLIKAGYHERELALVNAFKLNGVPYNLADALGALPNVRSVIALGNKAYEEFLYQVHHNSIFKIWLPDIRKLPHPQYWKRFHFNKTAQYVKLLKEAR